MEFLRMIVKYITTFGVWDIIDIAIVAFLIYKIMIFSRRTNAGQVVKAIALLLVLTQLSDLLGLNLLNFLLVNTVQLGLLALVIVFQPELRSLLERLGSKYLMQSFIEKESDTSDLEIAIVQTVDACKSLSWSRTGALIVFERNMHLNNIIKTGTTLDAKVSAELLKNVFYPKAPLHDGALIVCNGKATAAGCMLPLSGNTNLSKQLGMRHRAGVGMSESSDAVVVVVSEETGSISVAIGGMLKRHLAPETLEKLLRNELMPDADDNKKKSNLGQIFSSIFHKKVESEKDAEVEENEKE